MERNDAAHKLLELNSLIEFSQLINSKLNLNFILGNILLSIMGKMMITKGAVLIRKNNAEPGEFLLKASKGLPKNLTAELSLLLPKDAVFEANSLSDKNELTISGIKTFFKIYFEGNLIGLLALGSKANKQELSKSEIIFIETLLNLSSSSIENSLRFDTITGLNKELSGKVHQLRSLFEMSKEFNGSFISRDKVLKLLDYTLLGNFGIRDYMIFSKFKSEIFYPLNPKNISKTKDFDLSVFEKVMDPIQLSEDDDVDFFKHLHKLGYQIIVPASQDGKIQTLVCLGRKLNNKQFSSDDIDFLQSLINLSVISLENSILFEEFLEKQKLENELKIAREIQLALLPEKIPNIPGYDCHGCNIPAQHVGGDYYDIIKLNENEFALVIADVSGKGTPASLLMSNIQSSVHSYLKLYGKDFDIADFTAKINSLIYSNTSAEKFITFFWGILNSKDNTLSYINAGHNHPLLYSGGKISELDEGGLMIGILPDINDYSKGIVSLKKGDVLVLYTDGVTEAQNNKKDEFGEQRLNNVIAKNLSGSSKDICKSITDNIKTFEENAGQFDDITLIILKRN